MGIYRISKSPGGYRKQQLGLSINYAPRASLVAYFDGHIMEMVSFTYLWIKISDRILRDNRKSWSEQEEQTHSRHESMQRDIEQHGTCREVTSSAIENITKDFDR